MKFDMNHTVSTPYDHPDEKIHVHLGITMAGAVSGGAYTAGVMDFLFETLDEWERQKAANRKILEQVIASKGENATWLDAGAHGFDFTLPMHTVTIDAMGGASAGAIATVLSALRMYRDYNGDGEGEFATESMLYDAWVNMSQTSATAESTFEEMLRIDDLSLKQPLRSLLSARPLDRTKTRLMKNLRERSQAVRRKYAPKVINLVLTITSLRPAPVGFKLSPGDHSEDSLYHEMKLHRGLARYQLVNDPDNPQGPVIIDPDGNYISINPQNADHLGPLFDIALASGAFPIGLPPRHIDNLPMPYVRKQLERMYHLDRPNSTLRQHLRTFIPEDEDFFDMYAVDGGVMNNDPFAEVNRVLSSKVLDANASHQDELHLSANVFIDPFPDFHKPVKYKGPHTIISAAIQLAMALLSQTRMKPREILEEFVSSTYYGLVYPSYSSDDNDTLRRHPLASEGLGGFSGFLARSLREFDYALGKRNARSFFRHYFYITPDKEKAEKKKWMTESQYKDEEDFVAKRNRILSSWFEIHNSIPERVRRFDPRQNKHSLPIIPDPDMGDVQTDRKTLVRDPLPLPKRKLNKNTIKKLRKPLMTRARKIVHTSLMQSNNQSGQANALIVTLFVISIITIFFFLIGVGLLQTAIVLATFIVIVLIGIYIVLPWIISSRVLAIIKDELTERDQLET